MADTSCRQLGCRQRENAEAGAEAGGLRSVPAPRLRSPSLGVTGPRSKFSWAPRERQRLCLARTILT